MNKYFFFFQIFLCFSLSSQNYRKYDDLKVLHFYQQNHENQTLAFVLEKKEKYLQFNHMEMGIFEAFELLNKIVDESDPDLQLPQSYHAFQTAEALRKDNQPRWLILTGLIHDLGKILTFYGEPQWAVVGDTFPVGCAFSEKIIEPGFFRNNPDFEIYQGTGIYEKHCGLRNVHMSWGHDEYLYHVVKNYLPEEASYIIRFHSFYPHHNEGEYADLLDDYDRTMLPILQLFSQYDLYSKTNEELPDVEQLRPYYEALVSEFFPEKINW